MEKYLNEVNVAITICDKTGKILWMNERSKAVNGVNLTGSNVLDCHPGQARKKIQEMMAERNSNSYTIEKNGLRKLIYQTPWYEDGEYSGFSEFSFEIPVELPHFVCKPKTE